MLANKLITAAAFCLINTPHRHLAVLPGPVLSSSPCPQCHLIVTSSPPSCCRTTPCPTCARRLDQCSIPAFEDLLDGHHNKRVMKLLYRTAEWHGFAKLRMHTQATLDHLDSLTNEYGRLMRSFRDLTCSQFDTEELPREVEARKRAQQRAHARGLGTTSQAASKSRRKKTLNLLTPKFHALGDYVHTIQIFGTTDSFSTQVV